VSAITFRGVSFAYPDAARAALHERRAGLALERGDLLRDGGLRERQRLGRRGERAAHRDLAEGGEELEVEHHGPLWHSPQIIIGHDRSAAGAFVP